MDLSLIGYPKCFSPKSSHLFPTNLGKTDMRADSPAQTDASMDVYDLPGELEAEGPLVSLILPADPKV